jgi:hypothetical protein
VMLLLEQHDLVAALHQKCCSGGPGRPATDHEYVGFIQWIYLLRMTTH